MTTETTPSATFETTVTASGNKTGIVVPVEAIERLGAGRRPPVVVEVNGFQYRSTVAVMSGQHMIGISAAVREASGLRGGDPIRVTLSLEEGRREVDMPSVFAEPLAATPEAAAFFAGLSNSLQRYHVDTINGTKATDTRRRRIDKAIALFGEGRKR